MNLLIVDDEIYVVRALQKNIDWKSLGIDQVFSAFHAAKAREILKANPVDIVVTDIEMPGESGLSLLRWIQEQGMDVIGICLTSHAEFSYAQEALRYRVMEYVVKPLNFQSFAGLIGRAVEKRKGALLVKEQQEKGLLWEYHQDRVKNQFWEALVKGMEDNSPDVLINRAEKSSVDYDFNTEYLLVLICIRRIQDHRQEWQDSREKMEYITLNMLREVLLKEEDACRIGWLDGRLWMILPEERISGLTENLENFLELASRMTGASMTAYMDSPCFGEQIHSVYRKLQECDRKNVTVDQGVLPVGDYEAGEEGTQIASVVEALVRERKIEQIPRAVRESLSGMRHIRFQDLFVQIEAVKFVLFSCIRDRGLDFNEFWTGDLIESHRTLYDSVENFEEWLCAAVARIGQMEESQGGDVIPEIRKFVRENIENGINREMIASHMGFSPDYLGRIFKRETGISLSEFIMEQKVERARELLEEDRDTIGNIAVRLGYSSFSYFTEVFRRFTGVVPSDYKRSRKTQ